MIDVACVCVGDKYPPELYVKQLYYQFKEHLTVPYQFNVLTDNPENSFYKTIDCNLIIVPDLGITREHRKLWWYKIYLFKCFDRNVFYVDLDTIIINNVDKFTTHAPDKFCICHDFNRKWVPNYPVSNSSVMCWNGPKYRDVWDNFIANKDKIIQRNRGDQDYLTDYFRNNPNHAWWPKEWAMSFKWEIFQGGLLRPGTGLDHNRKFPAPPEMYAKPEEDINLHWHTSIVVFHGEPKPYDTDFGRQFLKNG